MWMHFTETCSWAQLKVVSDVTCMKLEKNKKKKFKAQWPHEFLMEYSRSIITSSSPSSWQRNSKNQNTNILLKPKKHASKYAQSLWSSACPLLDLFYSLYFLLLYIYFFPIPVSLTAFANNPLSHSTYSIPPVNFLVSCWLSFQTRFS